MLPSNSASREGGWAETQGWWRDECSLECLLSLACSNEICFNMARCKVIRLGAREGRPCPHIRGCVLKSRDSKEHFEQLKLSFQPPAAVYKAIAVLGYIRRGAVNTQGRLTPMLPPLSFIFRAPNIRDQSRQSFPLPLAAGLGMGKTGEKASGHPLVLGGGNHSYLHHLIVNSEV